MNRKTLFAALGCTLLAFSMMGCNALQTTNHLQSITLQVALVNGVAPTSQGGFVDLQGNGGTIQLKAVGNYSSQKTDDLTNVVTYKVMVDPQANVDARGFTLIPPCQSPLCPAPSTPPYTSGTVEYSPTGLLTAVEPAVCTWVDVAALDPTTGKPTKPSWAYTGDYVVTASFGGITSQPLYVPVSSSVGNTTYNGQVNNPSAFCDSGTY